MAAPAERPTIGSSLRDKLRSGFAKRVVLAIAAGVTARLGLLALAIVVGRSFGAEDFGTFTFATGLALVVGQLAGLGWPRLMNRLIPELREAQDWAALRGLLRSGNFLVLGTSIIASMIIVVVAQFVDELSQALLFAALLVPPFALCILRRQQLVAFRNAHFGMLFDQGFGAVCTVLLFLALGGMALGYTIFTYALTTVIGTLIAAFIVHRLAPGEIRNKVPIYRIKTWMLVGLPIMIGMSSKLLQEKTDVLLLAPLANLQEVGLYGAAWRITLVLNFAQIVLMTIVTPALADAFAKRNAKRLRTVMYFSLTFTAVMVLPLTAVVMWYSREVIQLVFGPEFVEADTLLRILLIGQIGTCFGGVFANMLVLGGRQKAFAGWNVLMLLLTFGLCFALIPILGGVGAALSAATASVAIMVGQIYLAGPLWKGQFFADEDADRDGAKHDSLEKG